MIHARNLISSNPEQIRFIIASRDLLGVQIWAYADFEGETIISGSAYVYSIVCKY